MCIILELILVSLHESCLPSGWDIVVERQYIEMPSDWENIPYIKASLHPGSFNVYILLLLGTRMLFTLLTTLSLLSSHIQYCCILKDSYGSSNKPYVLSHAMKMF